MAWYSRTGYTSNNVFLPASVTFAGFLALLVVFSLVRYSKGQSQSRNSEAGKQSVRRSTRSVKPYMDVNRALLQLRSWLVSVVITCRERKEVDRWSPEKTMSDSPSGKVGAELQNVLSCAKNSCDWPSAPVFDCCRLGPRHQLPL